MTATKITPGLITSVAGVSGLPTSAWVKVGSTTADNSATILVTGLSSAYGNYFIALSDVMPGSDTDVIFQVGDSSGIDSGGTDYNSATTIRNQSTGEWNESNGNTSTISLNGSNTPNYGQAVTGHIWLHQPGNSAQTHAFIWDITYSNSNSVGNVSTEHVSGHGKRMHVINLDRIQIKLSSGNIASGTVTVWGLSSA
tara:strand:+ start:391 stop:981 length:591 start_codon:yes stop_codon:yes gene_type:complete